MGDFEKHIKIAKEKLRVTKESFVKKDNTVVGDLATKVVEQLVEADMARKGEHSETINQGMTIQTKSTRGI